MSTPIRIVTYDLWHVMGTFRIFISEHDSGDFYGCVFYYIRKPVDPSGDLIADLEAKTEYFISKIENDCYNQCLDWVKNNLKGPFNVAYHSTKYF